MSDFLPIDSYAGFSFVGFDNAIATQFALNAYRELQAFDPSNSLLGFAEVVQQKAWFLNFLDLRINPDRSREFFQRYTPKDDRPISSPMHSYAWDLERAVAEIKAELAS
jgi:hypothetical protein